MSFSINHVHKVQPDKKIRSSCKKKKKTRQTRPAFGQARKRICNQRQRTRMKGHVISLYEKCSSISCDVFCTANTVRCSFL